MVNDPISDFIIRLKNSSAVGKKSLTVPYSNMKFAIAELLGKKGYIGAVIKKSRGASKLFSVELLYGEDGRPLIEGVKRVSKPSRRLYTKSKNIRKFRSGYGISVFSTPSGIMADSDAKKGKVGGEFLFNIW